MMKKLFGVLFIFVVFISQIVYANKPLQQVIQPLVTYGIIDNNSSQPWGNNAWPPMAISDGEIGEVDFLGTPQSQQAQFIVKMPAHSHIDVYVVDQYNNYLCHFEFWTENSFLPPETYSMANNITCSTAGDPNGDNFKLLIANK